jgi:hypothetical protein
MPTDAASLATRILFVGNSYSSRNNLPRLIVELAGASAPPTRVEVASIVAGGASLKRHWNAGRVHAALDSASWNYVVLQEQSTLPFKSPQRYHESVRLFHPEIAKHGAKTVLYLTWARQQTPEKQSDINRAVEAIAAEIGAQVAPVGPAWQLAIQQFPDMTFYVQDGSHPSAAGSYLAACVFLVALFHRAPRGWAVSDSLRLDRTAAERLHTIAWTQGLRHSDPTCLGVSAALPLIEIKG